MILLSLSLSLFALFMNEVYAGKLISKLKVPDSSLTIDVFVLGISECEWK